MRPRDGPSVTKAPLPRVQGTLPSDLDAALASREARLAADPGDAPAAVRAAEILLRKARVDAQRRLRDAGGSDRSRRCSTTSRREYSALKMLGAVVSRRSIGSAKPSPSANRAIAVQQQDAWNYGTLGDAYLELGEWERAFDAFDTMVRLRPDAASYARVAYAHELQGELGRGVAADADGGRGHEPARCRVAGLAPRAGWATSCSRWAMPTAPRASLRMRTTCSPAIRTRETGCPDP